MRLFYTIFFLIYVGSIHAQSSWVEYLEMENPTKTNSDVPNVPSQLVIEAGTVNFYMDETRFNSDCGEVLTLREEDFISTSFPFLGHAGCPGPINSMTNNLCFNIGDIQEGISISSSGELSDEIILLIEGDFGIPSNGVGPNYFSDNTIIDFSEIVNSVGIKFLAPFHAGAIYTFSVYSANMSLLGSADFSTNALTPVFVGIRTDEPISQITITSPGSAGELLTNITYGQCAQLSTVPTIGRWGLFSLSTLILIFGVAFSKQFYSQLA